jgi:hypothetical protein
MLVAAPGLAAGSVAIMLGCTRLAMPSGLPSSSELVAACAHGMASATAYGTLVNFDYTFDGLRSPAWRQIVSRMRGLAVDIATPDRPVVVWSTPIVADLHAGSKIPAAVVPCVQEKIDGVLTARFWWHGRWRWITRGGMDHGIETLASSYWPAGADGQAASHDEVQYFELCDPSVPTPTHVAEPGLYLLDVIDRRDGSARDPGEVGHAAQAMGLRMPRQHDWPGGLLPFIEELCAASPAAEGYVFRWGHAMRGRLVNKRYELLWNLLELRTPECVADMWLTGDQWEMYSAWVPAELADICRDLWAELDSCATTLADADRDASRAAAAEVFVAASRLRVKAL